MSGVSSLWTVDVNPVNLKCTTLPILSLRNPYSRAFHLSWLGFLVAFLSWFAFPPLIPEAIKKDLKLTTAQVGNSNIVALLATLIVRAIVGPMVDRYGPRKVMAALLIIGAIPSGLAGTVTSANGLYAVRFFIGILGGTFVPCQAWTTAFFDKKIVGRANALVGGWGNAGGGITFIIMIALYNSLIQSRHLTSHQAWRAAFAIVPVPILFFVAALVLIFGTDHPAGRWSDRHNILAAKLPHEDHTVVPHHHHGHHEKGDGNGKKEEDEGAVEKSEKSSDMGLNKENPDQVDTTVEVVREGDHEFRITSELDKAINEPLTWSSTLHILSSPLTWLPALAYMTTFGFELAMDANLSNSLFGIYPKLGQTKAGYITSTYGLLNIVTRPLGGYLGDKIYKRLGVPGKKYFTLIFGLCQGLLTLGLGIYLDKKEPKLSIIIVLMVFTGIFNEMANGLNFSLVPHCNPNSNGVMSGIVGAMGNLGGVFFALVFRFQPVPRGKAYWICGIVAVVVNLGLMPIPVPER
ncbi:nitrate/nitrite porter [Sistotremastrum suecicum HHB10207 ss-3]|uniref:Nitrate/nitrite transporter n=1 Tax=Sistotremastrum suecicum HHB10207 ss-3 TaxID=1314776 RepID=A0A166D266_9AGAM|nr:nitrate/nitrite porter [Sistotremastrum suecicum HHB10207 ss-3]